MGDHAKRPVTTHFTPRPDGSVTVNITSHQEREFISTIAEQLRNMLMGSPIDDDTDLDDSLRRLFPTAYVDEPDHEREYRRLTRYDLLNAHLSHLDVLERCTTTNTVLKPDEVVKCLRALNALRLVIGTALDVSEDDDPTELLTPNQDEQDPQRYVRLQFLYLGQLLGELVDAADNANALAAGQQSDGDTGLA